MELPFEFGKLRVGLRIEIASLCINHIVLSLDFYFCLMILAVPLLLDVIPQDIIIKGIMLDIKQIESFYPENLRPFKRNLLREYVQYKILETVYESDWSQKLVFTGGTAIHLLHGNTRFSEALDFDNLGLDTSHFGFLISAVVTSLRRNGFKVENREVFRTAFRSYLKFSGLFDPKSAKKVLHFPEFIKTVRF